MALPEGYTPRKGDIITIKAKVKYNNTPREKSIHVALPGSHTTAIVDFDEVVSLHCRAWEQGDAVEHRSGDPLSYGNIAAICGEFVWVKLLDGEMKTYHANDLVEHHKIPVAADPIDESSNDESLSLAVPPPAPLIPREF